MSDGINAFFIKSADIAMSKRVETLRKASAWALSKQGDTGMNDQEVLHAVLFSIVADLQMRVEMLEGINKIKIGEVDK